MEILFCLNGEVRIHAEHDTLTLSHNQLIVFDSKEVHSIHSDSKLYMFLCIHVDKKLLSVYCPNLELYHIKCRPVPLDDPKAIQYIHLCQLAHELTRTNIKNASTRAMRSDGTALLMLADLIQYFSESVPGRQISDPSYPSHLFLFPALYYDVRVKTINNFVLYFYSTLKNSYFVV